jgi:hypothetical protein
MSKLYIIRQLKINLLDLISNLPDDIKQKIYYEYFDIKLKYERVMYIFGKQHGLTTFGSNILSRYIKKILNDEILISYFLKHSSSFKHIYEENMQPNNNNSFTLIKCKYLNFTLQWIWREYH